jgi:lipopolysaccharide transport protein LptA
MNKRAMIILSFVVAAAVPAASAQTNAPASETVAATPAVATNREPTVVTSERLHVDYARNMGTFEGNVLAIDPRITVRADKMTVFFAGSTNSTRQLQRILAQGGVVITMGDRKSTSDHAEYTGEDGKVVLTGNPQVKSPDGTVSGERITFWHGQDKMDVESGTRLIIYPEEQKKSETESNAPPKTPDSPP